MSELPAGVSLSDLQIVYDEYMSANTELADGSDAFFETRDAVRTAYLKRVSKNAVRLAEGEA